MAKVLIYNLKFNQMAAVTKASSSLGAAVISINKDDIHKSIEFLLDQTKSPKAGKDNILEPTELLIFGDFTSEEIDKFLNVYNSTGVPKIIYKAATTPINIKWSPAFLFEQLKNEISEYKHKKIER